MAEVTFAPGNYVISKLIYVPPPAYGPEARKDRIINEYNTMMASKSATPSKMRPLSANPVRPSSAPTYHINRDLHTARSTSQATNRPMSGVTSRSNRTTSRLHYDNFSQQISEMVTEEKKVRYDLNTTPSQLFPKENAKKYIKFKKNAQGEYEVKKKETSHQPIVGIISSVDIQAKTAEIAVWAHIKKEKENSVAVLADEKKEVAVLPFSQLSQISHAEFKRLIRMQFIEQRVVATIQPEMTQTEKKPAEKPKFFEHRRSIMNASNSVSSQTLQQVPLAKLSSNPITEGKVSRMDSVIGNTRKKILQEMSKNFASRSSNLKNEMSRDVDVVFGNMPNYATKEQAIIKEVFENGTFSLSCSKGTFIAKLDGIVLPELTDGDEHQWRELAIERMRKDMSASKKAFFFPIGKEVYTNVLRVDLFVGKDWMQTELLREGLAKVIATNYTKVGFKNLVQAQQRAQNLQAGLWLPKRRPLMKTPESVPESADPMFITEPIIEPEHPSLPAFQGGILANATNFELAVKLADEVAPDRRRRAIRDLFL